MALTLACLTGCYTTTGRTRIARDVPQHVESRPNGTHLGLAAVESEPGRVVVAAVELDMCREQERGRRTYDIETRRTKDTLSGGGGGHPTILILAPLLILAAIIYYASPQETVTVTPGDAPPEPYATWRGERAPCGAAPRPAPGVPLALALRQSPTRCVGWTATTGPDGTLALADVLDPVAAVPAPCDRLAEDGLLLVEAAPQRAKEGPPAERDLERTSDLLTLPLPPAQAAALAAGVPPVTLSGRASQEQWEVDALRYCAPQLSPGCLEALAECDHEAEEKGDVSAAHRLCTFATRRCEPRSAAFAHCVEGGAAPGW